MNWGELLFYGGIAVAAGAVLFGIAAFVTLRVKRRRLEAALDEEYGPRERSE